MQGKQKKTLFISYDTDDAAHFKIEELVERLESQQDHIAKVYYWQRDTQLGENFREYMKDRIKRSDTVLFFCSENAVKSRPVQKEISYTEILGKEPVPIFDKEEHIPTDLSGHRGLKFDSDINSFFRSLYIKLTGVEPQIEPERKIKKDTGVNMKSGQLEEFYDYVRSADSIRSNDLNQARKLYQNAIALAEEALFDSDLVSDVKAKVESLTLYSGLQADDSNFIMELEELVGENISKSLDSQFYFQSSEQQIVKLVVIWKNLTNIPESIGRLSALRELSIKQCSLEYLPETFGNLESLERLDLSNNRLSDLPESFGKLRSLKRLGLSSNSLQKLPENIGELDSLEWLNLSDNQLRGLPDSFDELKTLKFLVLMQNQFQEIPETIRGLTSLIDLQLASNKLTTIPDWIGELENLSELGVEDNDALSLSENQKKQVRELVDRGCYIRGYEID